MPSRPSPLSRQSGARLPQTVPLAAARRLPLAAALVLAVTAAATLPAQVVIEGRLHAIDPRAPSDPLPLSTILAIAALPGSQSEALSFRTWESQPAGWFRLSGMEGRYTLAFTNPAHFMPPMILTNQFLRDGERIDLRLSQSFDYACFHEESWDPKPARRYLQPFFAGGPSVTAVGFKLAADGVDAAGPGKHDVLVSIHRLTSDHPEGWPQVGPTATVPDVDCGGPKNYWFSAAWQSGEVPTEPGRQYAVSIRPARPDLAIQTFWQPRFGGSPGVYRIGPESQQFEPHDLWLAVSSDRDGLVIPYNKRVHRKFSALTHLETKWSQTWIAMGRGLASVVLYAAVSGKQPPLNRQRVAVRVRDGGPGGPVVGTGKIAVGNGDYTGDASWGHFVAVFAPGEVPLTPGQTYALEFESIETPHTVGDFVNIKGQASDGRAGFNPYRKCAGDDYPPGTAFRRGTEAQDFDLDLQIVEYEASPDRWEDALAGAELLINGTMDRRPPGPAAPPAWQPFQSGPGTQLLHAEAEDPGGDFLRVAAAGTEGEITGGWVQQVTGLDPTRTYHLTGSVRSTWPAGLDHMCRIGVDPTGQTDDPDAASIAWAVLPGRHGEWIQSRSDAHRPHQNVLSVWLRATCRREDPRFPFQADFDNFSLRRADRGVPSRHERQSRTGFLDHVPSEAASSRSPPLSIAERTASRSTSGAAATASSMFSTTTPSTA